MVPMCSYDPFVMCTCCEVQKTARASEFRPPIKSTTPTHGNMQPMPGGLCRTRDLCNRRGPRGGASLPPRLGAYSETRAHAPLRGPRGGAGPRDMTHVSSLGWQQKDRPNFRGRPQQRGGPPNAPKSADSRPQQRGGCRGHPPALVATCERAASILITTPRGLTSPHT